jgi:hypothetical protein
MCNSEVLYRVLHESALEEGGTRFHRWKRPDGDLTLSIPRNLSFPQWIYDQDPGSSHVIYYRLLYSVAQRAGKNSAASGARRQRNIMESPFVAWTLSGNWNEHTDGCGCSVTGVIADSRPCFAANAPSCTNTAQTRLE